MSIATTSRHGGARKNRIYRAAVEALEGRCLLSAAFDLTGLTALRNDPTYSAVDGSGIGVAVLDTGVFANHPDLVGNFTAWFDAVTNGRNAATDTGDTNPAHTKDPNGHGTHTSGTAASTNPDIGVAIHAKLIDVRVLPADNEARPQYDTVLAGLNWVIANQARYNIRVVNMSLGVPSVNVNSVPQPDDESKAIKQLEKLGVTVVSASGNGYGGFEALGSSVPGAFSTITVANTWEDSGTQADKDWTGLDNGSGNGTFAVIDNNPHADQMSASSQRSTLPNQVAAPGSVIHSTWNGDNGLMYNDERGTSMASPFVAGMVALMQDAAFTYGGRYLQPADVLKIIRDTADPIVDSQVASTQRVPLSQNANGQYQQAGPAADLPETGQTFLRVNVYRAIQKVRQIVTGASGPDPNPNPNPGQSTADTNSTLTTAVPMPGLNGTENYTATGSIGKDGGVTVGAKDVDLYKIEVDSPGVITFGIARVAGGADFTSYLRLFDANGAEMGNSSGSFPTVSTGRLAVGTYYFGVSSDPNANYDVTAGTGAAAGNSQGDYALTISLTNPDPDGVAQGANPVDLTNPITFFNQIPSVAIIGANIGTDPNPIDPNAAPVTVGATDVDMYEVVAPDTGILTINTQSQFTYANPVDTYVRVFDANLNEIATNDDIVLGSQTDSSLQVTVAEGQVYYIAVTTFGNRSFNVSDPFDRTSTTNETGDYDLYMSFNNGDQNGTVFGSVNFSQFAVNDLVNGTIGADFGTPLFSSQTNGGYKDVDFFYYVPTADGALDISALSPNSSLLPSVSLWDYTAGGDNIVPVATASGTNAHMIVLVTQNQPFYLSVTGSGNEGFNWFAPASGTGGDVGTYQLTASLGSTSSFLSLTDNAVNVGTISTITAGTAINANIGSDGAAIIGADDVDLYKFIPSNSQTVAIRTDTSAEGSADTYLRIFNAQGVELAHNDNANANTSQSFILISVTAGQTYYIGVNGASANAGAYNPMTGVGAVEGSVGDYRLAIIPASAQPSISIGDATITEGNTGTTNLTFTINLNSIGTGAVTAHYQTSDGTATAGSDYTATSGDISIPAGETSTSITVPIKGDTLFETNETFTVTLSNLGNSSAGTLTATGTILNDDTLQLSISDASVNEGNAGTVNAVFTVTLSGPVNQTVTVNYATADGTATTAGADYSDTHGTLTFNPGDTTQTINVPVIGDTTVEANETFVVNLSNPSGATLGDSQGQGTIVNDDQATLPTISVADASLAEGNSGIANMVFSVTLSAASPNPVTAHYQTSNDTATSGSDYAATSGDITIPAGQTSTTFNVVVAGDKTVEPNETFTVTLSNLSGATAGAVTATGTITNDDTAPAPKIRVFKKVGTAFVEMVDNALPAFSFGTVGRGAAAPSRIFKVLNSGNAAMSLGVLKVPKGFTILDPLVRTLAAGKFDLVKIGMATSAAGAPKGQLHFTSNDQTKKDFRVNIAGTVRATKTQLRDAAALPLFSSKPIGSKDLEEILD